MTLIIVIMIIKNLTFPFFFQIVFLNVVLKYAKASRSVSGNGFCEYWILCFNLLERLGYHAEQT